VRRLSLIGKSQRALPANHSVQESPLTKNITRLVHRKVEIKRLRGVKHTASLRVLRPLHADRHSAEESVHPQHDEVHEEDVAGHGVDCFAQGRAVGREDPPVEGEHAHLGEAHADVVEVV
jgi:hypothetical protein